MNALAEVDEQEGESNRGKNKKSKRRGTLITEEEHSNNDR